MNTEGHVFETGDHGVIRVSGALGQRVDPAPLHAFAQAWVHRNTTYRQVPSRATETVALHGYAAVITIFEH
jgi:hypothetical protein